MPRKRIPKNKMKELSHIGRLEHKYLPEFVYGGIDGAITTFAVVSGVVGASLGVNIVLILGFANLFADGFSMATSNYLSTKSEVELGEEKHKTPIQTALATFASFFIIGFIPLLPFIFAFATGSQQYIENQFIYSAILTALAFIIVGYAQGAIIGENKLMTSVRTLIIGGIAALIAYGVGYFIRAIIGF